jgi:hypothetical protein
MVDKCFCCGKEREGSNVAITKIDKDGSKDRFVCNECNHLPKK